MMARRVHALLAAGVQNPALISRWQKEPELLQNHGVAPESFDLATVLKFAGLTVKVRHNGVRREFPLTFRFMSVADVEIEVFAAYAMFHASLGRPYATAPEERAGEFIDFLHQWLDMEVRNHALLWDLVRHEQTLALLAKAAATPPGIEAFSDSTLSQRASPSSVPVIFGRHGLHEMRSDPRALEAALFQRPPRLDQLMVETHYYCYWRAGSAVEVQALRLDEFGYYALSFIDGSRTAAELSSFLGAGTRPTGRFLRSLDQLVAVGLVGFKPTKAS